MRKGLVVGKFMPLHRGHQLLIESALADVDELTVVVYDSEVKGDFAPMPIRTRIQWIADLYPQVYNIVPVTDPLSGLSQTERDNPKYASLYAEKLAFLKPFDVIFSSEEYGEPFAKALGAESHIVDAARGLVPISGTQIRENIYECRGYVDPRVYRDLIQKVVFVGTESAGKSTLAEAMANELGTKWVHEYGRELWIEQDLKGSFHDLLKIAENQYRREEAAALHSNRFLFCDTNPWTTLQWSLMYNGTADARLFDLVERTKDEYIWILCSNDIPFEDDGVRELFDGKAEALQAQIIDAMVNMDIKYHVVAGSLDKRLHEVKNIIGAGRFGEISQTLTQRSQTAIL